MTIEKTPTGWLTIRQQLQDWTKPALVALVKDLYGATPEFRDFLQARFAAEAGGGAVLEKYRAKIVEQFYPRRGFGKLKLGEARKAIRDYRKASGDVTGTIDLMLTYVENGTEFTREFGDINEAYYNSMESVLDEMVKLLLKEGAGLYPRFRARILHMETHTGYLGWGYGDYLQEQIVFLEDELAGDESTAEPDKAAGGPTETVAPG
ncbi:MAG: hypothetical protein WCV00_06015 [Verrucomicrobiia bacterium]|jgi:hypothetical protein